MLSHASGRHAHTRGRPRLSWSAHHTPNVGRRTEAFKNLVAGPQRDEVLHTFHMMSVAPVQHAATRAIWGDGDLVCLTFAAAAVEFAVNRAVDWLFFTGALPP